MNTLEASAIVREALDKVAPGCPTPTIMYTRAYVYCGRYIPLSNQIKLSLAWRAATPEGKRQTLVHEAMHAADFFLSGRCNGHALPWKILMMRAGARPDRCSNDPSALACANEITWHRAAWVHCPCRSHRVSARMRTLIAKAPGSRICARCRQVLTLTPSTLEETISKCALDLAS